MAPRVIPKLRPIPAIIGMSRDRIRNAFLPIRVTISLRRYAGDSPEIGIQNAHIIMNMIGTELERSKLLKSVFFFIVYPLPYFL